MHHLIDLHFTAAPPFAELARTVGANWKIIDKETKEYCMTVSNLIQARHSELIAKERGQSKKKKSQLVQQREVSSPKVPYEATVKTNSDTKPPIVHYATSNVYQVAVSSNVVPSSKASMAMDTLGTFRYGSTSLDAMNEMCCLPFSNESALLTTSDVSSLNNDTTPWPEDEIIPVIANVNQRATIAADMMRANVNLNRRAVIAADMRANDVMAWTTCNEEKVSSPMKTNSPPYTLPFCQPVSEEPSVGMILCRPYTSDFLDELESKFDGREVRG